MTTSFLTTFLVTVEPLIDSAWLQEFEKMTALSGVSQLGAVMNIAKGLASIAILITFSITAYGMMAGSRKLDIFVLLRPFVLLLIIVNFATFASMIAYPFSLINQAQEKAFTDSNELMTVAFQARERGLDTLIEASAAAYGRATQLERQGKHQDLNWYDLTGQMSQAAGEIWDQMAGAISEFAFKADQKIHYAIIVTLDWIMTAVLRFVTYAIILIASFFLAILTVLGPLAFGMSAFSGFQQNWASWVSRYISVVLYKGIAYLVLTICVNICLKAIQHDSHKISALIKQMQAVGYGGGGPTVPMVLGNPIGDLDLLFGIIAMVAAFALLSVPVISTWIISTGGISPAVTRMAGGAAAVAAGGVGIATKGAKAMAGGIGK